MRFLGLDVGERTIGVALSDELALTAQPLLTLRRTTLEEDLSRIASLVEEREVSEVVVGMPYTATGAAGAAARKVESFIAALRARLTVPVVTWDERFSTVAVERVLLEGNVRRARRREVIDSMAAAYILQGYLDFLRKKIDR